MFSYARHVRNRNVTHPIPRQPDARAHVIGAYIAGLYLSTLAIAVAGGGARAGCAHARRYPQRSHPPARASLIAAFYCSPLIRLAQLLPLAGVAATAELQSSGRRARAPARQNIAESALGRCCRADDGQRARRYAAGAAGPRIGRAAVFVRTAAVGTHRTGPRIF